MVPELSSNIVGCENARFALVGIKLLPPSRGRNLVIRQLASAEQHKYSWCASGSWPIAFYYVLSFEEFVELRFNKFIRQFVLRPYGHIKFNEIKFSFEENYYGNL